MRRIGRPRNSPHRVTVIQQYAIPRSEAGGTRHIDLFGRLAEWTPTIIAGNFNHTTRRQFRTDDPRFRLVPLPRYQDNGRRRVFGLLVFAAESFAVGIATPADVVVGSSPQILAPLSAWVVAALKRVPFVLEIRDLWPASIVAAGELKPGSLVYRVLAGLESFLCRRAARIIVVTDGWEEHFRRLGVTPNKLVVIPNGTERAESEVLEDRAALRAEFGISGFTAVFAGSHGPKDGIGRILEAAQTLPDVKFVLIGDGAVKAEMVRLARQRRLDNVQFRSPIAKHELPRFLASCDVGLHVVEPLSVFDLGMSPNKLFDYLAAGIPVISNAPVALRNVVQDDAVGTVVAPEGLAEGIRRVRDATPAIKDRWRDTAARLLVERYSRTAAASRLEEVLDGQLNPQAGRPEGRVPR